MLSKILAILICVLILICIILFFIIQHQKNKFKQLEYQKQSLKVAYDDLKELYFKVNKEYEIEKKHKEELAKKLSDISSMSIDDVLKQLQDNPSN